MAIGSGVLLRGVAENPTFPILSALAYTTGLGYRPTCDILAFIMYGHVWGPTFKSSLCLPLSECNLRKNWTYRFGGGSPAVD